MIALVDTSVWSLALRRSRSTRTSETKELAELVREGRAGIIGPIRQELLSGVRSERQFDLLREHLSNFPDIELAMDDFELAARFCNQCRARGVQGTNTDFLICAVAVRRRQTIFTVDRDFTNFARMLPIVLHESRN